MNKLIKFQCLLAKYLAYILPMLYGEIKIDREDDWIIFKDSQNKEFLRIRIDARDDRIFVDIETENDNLRKILGSDILDMVYCIKNDINFFKFKTEKILEHLGKLGGKNE